MPWFPYSDFSSQTVEDASQPCSSWAQNKGGVVEPQNRCTPAPQKLQLGDTHSLLRLSSPVKAPLVSSIVPEILLWSRSLGRRRKEGSPSSLSSQLSLTSRGKTDGHPLCHLEAENIWVDSRCPAVMYGQHKCKRQATGSPFYTPRGTAWHSQPSHKVDTYLKHGAPPAPWAAPHVGRAGPGAGRRCRQHMGTTTPPHTPPEQASDH